MKYPFIKHLYLEVPAKSLVKKIEPIISKEVAKNLEKTAKQVENYIQKKNS